MLNNTTSILSTSLSLQEGFLFNVVQRCMELNGGPKCSVELLLMMRVLGVFKVISAAD